MSSFLHSLTTLPYSNQIDYGAAQLIVIGGRIKMHSLLGVLNPIKRLFKTDDS